MTYVNLRDLSVVIGENCSDFAHCFTVAPLPSIPRSTVPKEATRTSVLGRKLMQIYRTRRDPDTTWSCTTGRRITGSQPDNEQLYFQRLVPDRNGHREWECWHCPMRTTTKEQEIELQNNTIRAHTRHCTRHMARCSPSCARTQGLTPEDDVDAADAHARGPQADEEEAGLSRREDRQASGRGRLPFQIMHLQPSLRHLVNAALERSHPCAKTLSMSVPRCRLGAHTSSKRRLGAE